jgi:hypothetical protein
VGVSVVVLGFGGFFFFFFFFSYVLLLYTSGVLKSTLALFFNKLSSYL